MNIGDIISNRKDKLRVIGTEETSPCLFPCLFPCLLRLR